MLFSEYAAFVCEIDQSVGKPKVERRDIAIYGIAAEIGSFLSAIKKAMLAAQDDRALVAARKCQEVKEEIGDVLWYSVSLGQQSNSDARFNTFTNDIRNLHGSVRHVWMPPAGQGVRARRRYREHGCGHVSGLECGRYGRGPR
jgi:NTP pyrophosphatase (non-canonical NTP hydrolase)